MVDTVAHDLANLAIQATLRQIEPAAVMVWSDQPKRFKNCAVNVIDPLTSAYAADRTLWYDVPPMIDTSHVLVMQYDGWVLDGLAWKDHFLRYDYIGAPWPWHPHGTNVGNGGFSLRSTRLMKHLAAHRDQFPVQTPEDDALCRRYRRLLADFEWAPEKVAREFAFERETPHRTFGFHGIFAVPMVLEHERFREWVALAPEHVQKKSEWREIAAWVRSA